MHSVGELRHGFSAQISRSRSNLTARAARLEEDAKTWQVAARPEQNTGTCTEPTHRCCVLYLCTQVDFSAIRDPGCVYDFVDLGEI